MALTEFRSQPRIVPETSIATRIPLRGAGAHDVVSSPGWEHAAMRRAGSGPRPRLAIEEQAPQPLSVRAHAGAPRDGRLNLLRPENVFLGFRYIVGKSRHRAHTESQREESGESQFLGSLWRATLSREAWMPIWGLSTESMSPGRSRLWQRLWNQATEMVRGYGCSRGSRHAPTLQPSRTERLHPGKAQ